MSKKFTFIKKLDGNDADHDPNIICTHDQTFSNGAVRFTVTSNGVSPTFNVGGNTAITEGDNIYIADTDYEDSTTLAADGNGSFDVHVYQGNVTLEGEVRDIAEYGGAGGNLRANSATVTVSGLTNFETDHAQNAQVFISTMTIETVLPQGTNVSMNTSTVSGNVITLDNTSSADAQGNISVRNVVLEPNSAYTVEFVNTDRSNTTIDTSFQANADLSPFFYVYDPAFADDYSANRPVGHAFDSNINTATSMVPGWGMAVGPPGNDFAWLNAPDLYYGNGCIGSYWTANNTYAGAWGNAGNPGDSTHIGTFCNISHPSVGVLEWTGCVAKHDGNIFMMPGTPQIGNWANLWQNAMSWSTTLFWPPEHTSNIGLRGESHGNISTTYQVELGLGTTYLNRHGAALAPTGDIYSAPIEESQIVKFDYANNTCTHVSGSNVSITRNTQNTSNRIKAYGRPVTHVNGKIYMPGYAQYDILELNPYTDTYGSFASNANTVPGTYAFTTGCVLDDDRILFVGEKWSNDVRDFGTDPIFSTMNTQITAFGVMNTTANSFTISDFNVTNNSGNSVGRGGAVSAVRGPDGNAYVTTPAGDVISFTVDTGVKQLLFSARDVDKNGGAIGNDRYSCTNAILAPEGAIIPLAADSIYPKASDANTLLHVYVIGQDCGNTWPLSAYHAKN